MILSHFLGGCIVVSCWAIALFFLRFWRKTHDRLFIHFAVAFLLLGGERIALVLLNQESEYKSYVYLIRLAAILVIVFAIVQKNRSTPTKSK
jgi:Ca2+/Na+ antiporter